jgi:hypothetical protein
LIKKRGILITKIGMITVYCWSKSLGYCWCFFVIIVI